jgi:signal transduction histidine kinase/DNA-binding response OmpR family regulator/HAMP domain-containing protein
MGTDARRGDCDERRGGLAGTVAGSASDSSRTTDRSRHAALRGTVAGVRRLSIARSVQVALLGLTIALTAIAGLGVGALYSSRQHYEDRLAEAFEVKTVAGKLLAASVVEEATVRARRSPSAGARARRAYEQVLADAQGQASDDDESLRHLQRAQAAQARLRRPDAAAGAALAARAPIDALARRQDQRLDDADADARRDSREALAAIIAAGGLALAGAIALVALLMAGVRRPLDNLVDASGRLADGDLAARVDDSDGPTELRELGHSFNAMATDLEAANGRIEAERRRLDVTLRSLGDGLVLLDGEGLVSTANPRAMELAPLLRIGHPPGIAGLALPAATEALRSEALIEHEGRILAATAARLDEDDSAGSVVWTLRDATERTRLEQLKSEFVATASHELRSPLTSIKGFIELLRADDDLDDRQREFVDIVLASTNRLVDLVNDLLDVARLEAGRMEVHRRPIDAGDTVREVAELLAPRIEAKGQRLDVEIDRASPRVLADPARLRQILVNLVTNAHLYSGEGGRIAIRAARSPSGLRLEVADDGSGMAREELELVFERFSRGRASTGTPGTGLGLSIVKSLVDLHGGSIDVSSAPGEGTTFAITLPAVPQPGERGRPREALAGRRVLVIDDDPDAARLIAERLEPCGVSCVLVHNGVQALELLRADRFDAATLDVLMPGMSGFEVLRELRADQQLADLPVVVVSVFSGREALAGEWVVSKPVDTEELVDALGAAVLAGRVRVLAVGRANVSGHLRDALQELAIEHEWASTPLEAARLCASRRFEVALVDAGLPDAEAAVAGLELRGRRLQRSILLVSADGDGEMPAGLAHLDAEVIALQDAGAAVLALLDPSLAADL